MRRFLTSLLGLALASAVAAADVSFLRVWPQWQDAEAFDRVREHFGGSETRDGQIILRTQPKERGGMYFLIRVECAQPVAQGTFVVEVIRPDTPDTRRFTFATSLPAKSHVVELGLTGADWPGGADAHPVAWKVTLVDAEGRTLAAHQSFLWERPAQ